VGSSKNPEAHIFLETQPWSVMAGLSDNQKLQMCMNSVKDELATKYGIMLLQPPFKTYQPQLGEISTYPAGLKENASIFCHPNPWAMIAETILGRGNQAFEYYRAILPAAQNNLAELRKVEPYVYCQTIAGKNHVDFGEGKNSWLTGSAAWNFVAAIEYILGIRPNYNGLIIDPCIPKNWKGFKVKRVFRGTTYIINVKNTYKVQKGVSIIKLDGKRLDSKVVPAIKDKKTHTVDVIMG
jgi:cellobiose phosphorylase